MHTSGTLKFYKLGFKVKGHFLQKGIGMVHLK